MLEETWENIPRVMRDAKHWLCYRLVDKGEGQRLSKPPYSPKTGVVVDKTDETHWASFHRAYGSVEQHGFDGLGFVFDNGFIAIDLDDCFEDNGSLTPVAQDILDHFEGAYVEYSPSGNGLHLFCRGVKPNKRTKDTLNHIEVYDNKNFVTVTGDITPSSGSDCKLMQGELDWLYDKYLPERNQSRVDYTEIKPDHGSKTPTEWLELGLERDSKLKEYYEKNTHDGDESSEDMILLNKLAYWLNRDGEAILEAFCASTWFESKDSNHKAKVLNRKDYIENSINNAINMVSSTAFEQDTKYANRAKVKLRSFDEDAVGLVDNNFLDDMTDAGAAKLLSDVFSDTLVYTSEFGWCYYNGKVWETGHGEAAFQCAISITQAILEAAHEWIASVEQEIEDNGYEGETAKRLRSEPQKLMRYALNSRRAFAIKSILEIAKPLMLVDRTEFDRHPWILNTPLCLIDLRTGERITHSPDYMCTQITEVTPDVTGEGLLWEKMLDEVFLNDKELIHFVQMHMGSALVGKVFNENLLIANGTGANGKSTFFGVISKVLGSYSMSVDPELLMSSRPSEQQVGMAMLHGKRFTIAQETAEGRRFDGAMLKRLVSTDELVAKKLYHNPFNFIPTHTLVLSTNHLPRVTSNDKGTWRRLVVVPFNATIAEKDTITDYMGLLYEQCGQNILQWCVDGARMFYEAGCVIKNKPTAVDTAIKEYRDNEDWLSQFLGECVEASENVAEVLPHSTLYSTYQAWCVRNGAYTRSSIALGKALSALGWEGKKGVWVGNKQQKVWYGYRLVQGAVSKKVVKIA